MSVLGVATPGDVLSYRKTWDAYVVETVRASRACADAWDAAAKSGDMSTVNVSQFQIPPDATTLGLWASAERNNADSLLSAWNMWADTPDWQILASASDILKDFQRTVLRAGQIYRPTIAQDCPDLAAKLPAAPTFDVQSELIGSLEGLGVVAHGVLQLLGIGAGGVLDTAGAIAQGVVQAAKTVQKVAEGATSAAPLLAFGVGLGAVVLLARR